MGLYAVMAWMHMPAALLLASMGAGILTSSRSFSIRVPKQPFLFSQGLVGCLMAQSLHPSMFARVAGDWPLLLGFAALVMGASAGLGWWLARHQVLPGTTAVWGLAPGAASAMVLMSDAYGADGRLVAFMQYSRVVIVTCIAALVTRIWIGDVTAGAASSEWFTVLSYVDVFKTIALVVSGMVISHFARLSTGAMLLPLIGGVALQAFGWLIIELPPLVLAAAYMLIGWTIGLRYTPATLAHAWKALPRVLMSIAALVLLGAAMATLLVVIGHFDPLTAYLATSPGGADSVAIIAAHAATVDAGFVMAMQLGRFVLVFLFGPQISRWVAQRT